MVNLKALLNYNEHFKVDFEKYKDLTDNWVILDSVFYLCFSILQLVEHMFGVLLLYIYCTPEES